MTDESEFGSYVWERMKGDKISLPIIATRLRKFAIMNADVGNVVLSHDGQGYFVRFLFSAFNLSNVDRVRKYVEDCVAPFFTWQGVRCEVDSYVSCDPRIVEGYEVFDRSGIFELIK